MSSNQTNDRMRVPSVGGATRRRARRGLTLAELMIATVTLTIVAGAASTFALAVASGWRAGDSAFRLGNLSARSGDRIEDVLGRMLYVLQASTSTEPGQASYLFYWSYDGLGGAADGKAQLGEMALIEYDPTTRGIWLREPIAATAMTGAQLTTASQTNWGDPTAPAIVTYFKSLDFVGARQTVIGGQSGASEVEAASFGWFAPGGAKPIATYSATLRQQDANTPTRGTIVLRTARRPSNLP